MTELSTVAEPSAAAEPSIAAEPSTVAGTLWQAITAQADLTPDRIAVDGDRPVSYRELIELTGPAASRLAEHCGPGDVVAIRCPTSLAGLVAILATARAGAAFLPLDIAAPPGWQQARARDLGARAMLSPVAGDPVGLEVDDLEPGGQPVPPGTAYVMLTSGSTGAPKGVLVPGRALIERLTGLAQVPGFGPDDSFLALTALSFDISLAELLLPLVTGGQVLLAPSSARLDPAAFEQIVRELKPTVIQATPSFWRLVLAAGWTGTPATVAGSVLWCGGEALPDGLAGQLLACGRALWNVYGPTEATIWCTASRVEPGRPVSLGDPLPGSHYWLLDDADRAITAAGLEGELVLGGAGLASGYAGAPADQARFTRLPGIAGPVYRTGDRAVYRPDGTLAFLGRQDGQIKLRGHRLELGAVEAVIEGHPDVGQAFVQLCEPDDPKRAHLAAVVSAPESTTARELRRWLAERVPPVMLPKRITVWPSLPRTTAGKLDRVALRELIIAGEVS